MLVRLVGQAVIRDPLPLALDLLLALIQGGLYGGVVAALAHLVDVRTVRAVLWWGGAQLLVALCGRLRPVLTRRAQNGIRLALGEQLAEATTRLPYGDFERSDLLRDLERATSVLHEDRVYQLVQGALTMVTEGSRIVAVGAVLVGLSPWLALPTAAAGAVQVWTDVRRMREQYSLYRQREDQQRFADYLAGLPDDPAANAETRIFGARRWLIHRWYVVWRGLQAGNHALADRQMRRDALTRGATLAVYLGAFAWGVVLAAHGRIHLGGVVALAAGVRSVQVATEEISYQMADGQRHILHLLDAAEVIERSATCPPSRPFKASETITATGLTYRYPGSRRRALRGVDLELRRGHLLALVGENGSGKTTLIRILLGLLEPDSGSIAGDGEDFLRPSAVFQDFVHYNLSVREEVGLGDWSRQSDDASLWEALNAAGPAAVAAAQLGLDALPVLSGGQWQALALARGLFAQGDLVILDEPTAALDPLAERELFDRFVSASRGRFAVIVTHRMGVAQLADTVAVMDAGRIVERGSHDELLLAGGRYARMWEAQSRWYRE